MMKPLKTLLFATLVFLFTNLDASALLGGSAALYGTYWNADESGYGAGLKLNKSLFDILYIDGRGGYVSFDSGKVEVIPLEASLNIGLPGPITPYAGVGVGYYLIDAPGAEDLSGQFGQIGIEFTILKLGVMAELRYLELEKSYFDGLSANAGIMWKF